MLIVLLNILVAIAATTAAAAVEKEEGGIKSVLIKIGGSSITNKAVKEELNPTALDWFAKTLQKATRTTDDGDQQQLRFVIVHGAGSFGHFTAKEYGLKGRESGLHDDSVSCSSAEDASSNNDTTTTTTTATSQTRKDDDQAYRMKGLSATRLSVQKLNNAVVASLVDHGLPAIGISPCFGILDRQAHGENGGDGNLAMTVRTAVQAGLIPVLHGDACLWGRDNNTVGILSGDTIMEMLGVTHWISRAIFLTDVDGIFTSDPHRRRRDDNSTTTIPPTLIPTLRVDTQTGRLLHPSVVDATESHFEHDVTGGLKTKLKAAIRIAASGKIVTVARSQTLDAEHVIFHANDNSTSTTTTTFRGTTLLPV